MANLTAVQDETNTLDGERFRSIPSNKNKAAFFIALNVFLSITASLGNALILIALHKVTSIFPPTKLLFRCLAVTDLCGGLISQPLFAVNVIPWLAYTNSNLSYYIQKLGGASSFILGTVSILTSTAISVDRLLALLLGLRYRHVVTLKRVRGLVICLWLLSCGLGGWRYSTWGSAAARRITFTVVLFLSLVTSVFSYTNIYLRLRHRHLQVRDGHFQQAQQPNRGTRVLNIARYKKMASSIEWLQFTLLVCYLPFIIVSMLSAYNKIPAGASRMVLFRIAVSILYLNSSLNPLIYCWKIREVRKVVKDTIRQLNCSCESI